MTFALSPFDQFEAGNPVGLDGGRGFDSRPGRHPVHGNSQVRQRPAQREVDELSSFHNIEVDHA